MQLRGLGDDAFTNISPFQPITSAYGPDLTATVDPSTPVDTTPSAGTSLNWLTAIAQPAADIAKAYFTAETAKAVAPYQYSAAYPRYTAAGQPIRYSPTGQPIGVGYPAGQLPGAFGTSSMMPVLLLGGAALIAFMIFSKG